MQTPVAKDEHGETRRPSTVAARHEAYVALVRQTAQRLADPGLTLDHVAAAAFVSRRQAQRVFAERRTSFRATLLKLRMDLAARRLLEHPDAYVRDVALSVGYREPAQFAKAFRRHHGVAPAEFRRTRAAG